VISIPAAWPAPQITNSVGANYVTVSFPSYVNDTGTASVVGQDVVINGVSFNAPSDQMVLVYGSGAGVLVPVANTYTFTVASDPAGTNPVPIASPPQVMVTP
jgi:hypothetical protein